MAENPLEVVFQNREDPVRFYIMQRDVGRLTALGFSRVAAQKSLFAASGD